jgi:hypothetical protein
MLTIDVRVIECEGELPQVDGETINDIDYENPVRDEIVTVEGETIDELGDELAKLLRELGTVETHSAPSFYDPDGTDFNPFSGIYNERTAHVKDNDPITNAAVDRACSILE